jgi:hypothetical protein
MMARVSGGGSRMTVRRYSYSNVESICRRAIIDNAIGYIHNDCRAIVHSKKYINERELVLQPP